jgi:hypothetical protein
MKARQSSATELGGTFVSALAERDFGRLAWTLAPDVRLRALIPPGPLELSGASTVAARFAAWFAEADGLELVFSGSDEIGERLHVFYRLRVKRPGDPWKLVEQHLFGALDHGRFAALDLVCSGFRPEAPQTSQVVTAAPTAPSPLSRRPGVFYGTRAARRGSRRQGGKKMKYSTYLIRFKRLLVLGAVAAGIAVPAASAHNGSPPDVRDVAANLAGTTESLVVTPPDVRDAAAAANVQVGDGFERYAKAHPYGTGLSNLTSSTLVSRPPDISDAAEADRYSVAVGQSSGFHWADWAIGIGSGMGLFLLLGTGVTMGLQRRHRTQTA